MKWKLLKSRDVYHTDWFNVREDRLLTEKNEEITYSVIEFHGGGGVVVLENDQIYLVGQYRYTLDKFSWEIVKGALTGVEKPEETIKRELAEETGIRAKSWQEIGFVNTLIGSTDDRVHLFLARDLEFGKPHPEKYEEITLKKVTFEEFEEMVEKGEVTDATSIAAVHIAKRFLGK